MPANTKRGYIDALHLLSKYVIEKRNGGKYKPLREFTWEDFFAKEEPKGYLRSLKSKHAYNDGDGQNEKWVNTHNTRGAKYHAFWRWWTQPDLPPEERQTPLQLKGYKPATRHSKTNIKREDHWTDEEHRVFLQYCQDLRVKCFHAMHRDIGGRPGELLQVKLGDIKPKPGETTCRFYLGEKGKNQYSYQFRFSTSGRMCIQSMIGVKRIKRELIFSLP
jgi:integrase